MIPMLNANSLAQLCLKKLAFEEHARAFAELNDGAGHTFFPEGIAQVNTDVVSTQNFICQGLAIRYRNRWDSFYDVKLLIGARPWAELQPMALIVLGFQELQVVFPITDCVAHTLWIPPPSQ